MNTIAWTLLTCFALAGCMARKEVQADRLDNTKLAKARIKVEFEADLGKLQARAVEKLNQEEPFSPQSTQPYSGAGGGYTSPRHLPD